MTNYKRVPTTRFLRERNKWFRYVDETGEPIIITHRSREDLVLLPIRTYEKFYQRNQDLEK